MNELREVFILLNLYILSILTHYCLNRLMIPSFSKIKFFNNKEQMLPLGSDGLS